jgi:hypothetical protein
MAEPMKKTLTLLRTAEPARQDADRDKAKALKRIDTLTASLRAAQGQVRFWRAVAMTAMNTDPSAAAERFQAGMAALLDGLQVDNPHLAPQLAPEAAAFVLSNLHGPHLALYLVNDPALAERFAALPAAEQLVELGRLSVAVEAALRPPSEQPRTVLDLFGLVAGALA